MIMLFLHKAFLLSRLWQFTCFNWCEKSKFPSLPSLWKLPWTIEFFRISGSDDYCLRRGLYQNSHCRCRSDIEIESSFLGTRYHLLPKTPVPDCSRRLRFLLFNSSQFFVILALNSWNHVVSPQCLSAVTAATAYVLQLGRKVKVFQSWKLPGKHLIHLRSWMKMNGIALAITLSYPATKYGNRHQALCSVVTMVCSF